MFETGNVLRAAHGADKVCDFSLGNPDVEPPQAFQQALEEVVSASVTRKHGYMPNAGYPESRARVSCLTAPMYVARQNKKSFKSTFG